MALARLRPEILPEVDIGVPHVFFEEVSIQREPHIHFLEWGHHYIDTLHVRGMMSDKLFIH